MALLKFKYESYCKTIYLTILSPFRKNYTLTRFKPGILLFTLHLTIIKVKYIFHYDQTFQYNVCKQ